MSDLTSLAFDVDDGTLKRLLRAAASKLESDVLPGYLKNQRWYAGKSASITNIKIDDVITFPAPEYALCVVSVEASGLAKARYLLPLTIMRSCPEEAAVLLAPLEGSTGYLVDAFCDLRFPEAVAETIFAPRERQRDIDGKLSVYVSDAGRKAPSQPSAARSLGVEQSNTSVRLGDRILKGLRKLEAGIHPEFEVSRFLGQQGFPNTPELYGAVEYRGHGSDPATIFLLQSFIPSEGDGWAYACQRLEIIGNNNEKTKDATRELLHLAENLGKRTAELHYALAAGDKDDAFRPEPLDENYLNGWRTALAAEIETTCTVLERAASLDESTRKLAISLPNRAKQLKNDLGRLIPEIVPAKRTRIHGDFHLGQVLVTRSDVFIIDFEGEPLRSLNERRAKHVALRDVAGMLRSFDYAGASAMRATEAGKRAIQDLVRKMSESFLAAYANAISGCEIFPEKREVANALLRTCLLEKALYEVRYELANRPSWAGIPLASLDALLTEMPGPLFERERLESSPSP